MSKSIKETLRFIIDGVRYEVEIEGEHNERLGEATFSHEEVKRAELAVATELIRRGQVTPEAFRFIRKAHGIAAKKLAMYFDTAPETISRWETGANKLPRYAFMGLAWISAGTDGTRWLEGASAGYRAGETIRIEASQEVRPHLTPVQRRAIVERMTAAAKSAVEGL